MPVFGLMTAGYPYEQTPLRDLALPILVVEIALVVLLALSCNQSIFDRLGQVRRSTWVLVILWLVSITSSTMLAAPNPPAARDHLTLTVIHVAFAWLVFDELKRYPHFGSLALKSIAAGLVLFGAIVVVFAQTVEVSDKAFWGSLGVGFTNIRHFGFYSLILFCLSAGLYLSTGKPAASRLWVVAIGLALLYVYWSGSRGAFFTMHATFVFQLILLEKGQRIRLARLVVTTTIVAIPLAYALVPNSELYGPQNIFFRIQPIDAGMNEYSSGRIDIWIQTIKHIVDQPVLGYGEAQFRWAVELAKGQHNHPHNIILQSVFQWGVVGTLLLLAWVLNILRIKRWKMLSERPELLPGISLVFGIGALSSIDSQLFYIFPIMTLLMCIAILVAAISASAESLQKNA